MTHYRRALDQSRPFGPDRTPLVHRVLLGLACGVIVVGLSIAIWIGLLRHL